MKTKRLIPTIPVILLAVLACSLGGQSPAVPTGMQTLTALAENAAPNSTPQADGTPGAISTGQPAVHVNVRTACLTGPSTAFYNDNVTMLPAGFEAQAIGKDTADDYLLITLPAGDKCWLDAHSATLSGDASAVPEVPPPPTPTASPTATVSPSPTVSNTPITPTPDKPLAPGTLSAVATCTTSSKTFFTTIHVSLTWTDVANEDGYRIFRSDKLLQTLGANVTNFTDDTTLSRLNLLFGSPPPRPTITYGVEAYNVTGHSGRTPVTVGCP